MTPIDITSRVPDGDRTAASDRQHHASDPLTSRRRPACGPRTRNLLGKLAAAAILVGLWQLTYLLWLPRYAPSPGGVLSHSVGTVSSPEFTSALQSTLLAVAESLLLGCSLGSLIGLLLGRVAWLRHLSSPYVGGLYAMPMIALVPMMTIWLGYTTETRLVVVTLSAALPCIVSASDGARTAPTDLLEVSRVLRMRRRRVLTDLLLPATLPYVIAGVQVAVGRAVVGAVAVEILANLTGMGTLILADARSFHQDQAFVAVLSLAIVGLLARLLISATFRRLAPWERPRA
ncbi:MAG: hypothetical protein DLM61_10705 [Pseudonocardiales bacterium]|nr:MAG: hypothetical protein DLM61_10705 [Pseudonocardiales bacterium]